MGSKNIQEGATSQTVGGKNAEHIAESTGPKNRRKHKCTMFEGKIDTIVSAIHLMLERSHNAGVDFAEIVRQFLNRSLTGPEQSQFWAELKAEYPEKWPKAEAAGDPARVAS